VLIGLPATTITSPGRATARNASDSPSVAPWKGLTVGLSPF
jgi:hypothetical protein